MSLAALTLPVESSLPFVRHFLAAFGVAIFALRPLIGLGLLAALLWLFKPLLRGISRAALMLFSPRRSLAERNQASTLRSVMALNAMARELDTQQPGLAAELRLLAGRN